MVRSLIVFIADFKFIWKLYIVNLEEAGIFLIYQLVSSLESFRMNVSVILSAELNTKSQYECG